MGVSFADDYLHETAQIAWGIGRAEIERAAEILADIRARQGRLFCLGIGGGAAHASHAVNDFRKLAGFEAYAPTDNIAELTARANDEGVETIFTQWLLGSQLTHRDALLVFSVGGGNAVRGVSVALVRALEIAHVRAATIIAIVGRDGGYAATVADACVIVPSVNPSRVTPHTEGFQSVIAHLLVTHPKIQLTPAKWESLL